MGIQIKDLHAIILSFAMHHLGMNPQANEESPLKWTKASDSPLQWTWFISPHFSRGRVMSEAGNRNPLA
ncbi:hypothetical protein [Chamaesiphon sp. VAR_48_metabat_403]|uniref:hypothetical protein n=1 Tax=Chamaesiphon sp. VAR_48_metabat_403 TaxID=2964700 RepID=UPI00286E3778|nr:hypothetical protein [Chamaesiphon sp. VAR_48_metabat_403]